jgi:outer membrane protein
MKKIVFTIGTFFMIVSTIYSQTINEWSLEKCIDYAYTQNITIRKSELTIRRFEISAEQAKAQRLPSAGVTVTQNFNWTKRAVTQHTRSANTE